ncbi:MAG: signal peptidase I [Pirellulales bacterium]
MLSLTVLTAVLIAQLLIIAAVLVLAARAVASTSARFGTGLWVALTLYLLGVALSLVHVAIPAEHDGVAIGVGLALIMVHLLLGLLLFRRAFRLSMARALAPLAAYIGLTIVSAILLYAVIRPSVLEAFTIPTQSMAPTLNLDDRFVVNKLLTPRRWDLVAYQTNDAEPVISCKRLVGLPGESLRFQNGTLYVNDEALSGPEVLAGRYSAELADAPELTRYRDGQTIQLGDEEYFFVGDNVERSKDSRTDGPTDREKLIGVVDLIYWPFNRITVLR